MAPVAQCTRRHRLRRSRPPTPPLPRHQPVQAEGANSETAITNVCANLLSRFAIKVDGDPAVMLASAPAAEAWRGEHF